MWSIIGHDRVVSYLQRSLEKGTLSQAYLLTGARHAGKMTLALALAQAVNCTGKDKPCGECPSCQKIFSQCHPDVQVIRLLTAEDAEDRKDKSEIVIDQIRKVQHWANLPPYEGRYRVFIFEQAELMNEEAANCLLKTLEEPLPGMLFILLTTSEAYLPETIVSRCQHLELRPVPPREIEEFILSRGLDAEKARLMAKLSDGAPGWAVNALEHEELLSDRYERIATLLDLISQGYEERFQAADAFSAKKAKGRAETMALLEEWQKLWRDLLLARTGQTDDIVNIDFRDKLVSLCQALDLTAIAAFAGRLGQAIHYVKQNANARLVLEVLMLDMPRVDKAHLKR